jgi:hypothetical protein
VACYEHLERKKTTKQQNKTKGGNDMTAMFANPFVFVLYSAIALYSMICLTAFHLKNTR